MQRAHVMYLRAILVLVLAASCRPQTPQEAASNSSDAPECASSVEGSRWATRGGAYEFTGSYGEASDSDHWIEEIGGVVAFDTVVYVYDAGRARIIRLDSEMRPTLVFGREGGGPGELAAASDRGWRGPGWSWLTVADDRLAVFDGLRIQWFRQDGTLEGEHMRQAPRRGWVTGETDRIRMWNGNVLAPAGGYRSEWNRGAVADRWTLYAADGRDAAQVLSMDLVPRPRMANGAWYTGPDQAVPLWDTRHGCVIATDGTGRTLLRTTVQAGGVDTLPLDLPDLGRPKRDRKELERISGMAGKGSSAGGVRPTALRGVQAINIDPDGYAWILPVQDSAAGGEGVAVIRISLQTGISEHDVVPAFPVAFGPPGVFFSRAGTRQEPSLSRFEHRPEGEPR